MSSYKADESAVFPGEGWFFYWKTSASLWKSKILERRFRRLIVPINWAFHSETGEGADFGTMRPESDLFRLAQICHENAIEVCFLLPITPVPFLVNGGIPHLLARGPSRDCNGINWVTLDGENNAYKLYSFFDHRIYEAFAEFVDLLGRYFSEKGISCSVRGLQACYTVGGELRCYLGDTSQVFDVAFSRFLGANKREDLVTIAQEQGKREEFFGEILGLYQEAAKGALAANWEGIAKISFVGGNNSDFIKRAWGHFSIQDYFLDSQHAISWGAIPSSVLLPTQVKESVLGDFLDETATIISANQFFSSSCEGDALSFGALKFFDIFQNNEKDWEQLGLCEFLEEHYPWTYRKKSYQDREGDFGKILFCSGREIDNDFFNFLVKKFLNGFNIVINQSGLSKEIRQKLMTFILENLLETEKVNKYSEMMNITLGDGRITLFNGEMLQEQAQDKNMAFWKLLFSTYDIRHINLNISEGIEIFWKTRETIGNELNYEEIRRLSLYNRTSYKKRQKIRLIKNSVLTKIANESNATVKNGPEEVEVHLLPSGKVSLDFGFYS